MNHLLNVLAVFRLTRMIQRDDLPFELMAKLRDHAGVEYNPYGVPHGTTELSKAISCVWCLSIWVALVVARGNLRNALAYSGAAAALSTFIDSLD